VIGELLLRQVEVIQQASNKISHVPERAHVARIPQRPAGLGADFESASLTRTSSPDSESAIRIVEVAI
jgi:hypothetical protein